MVRLTAIQSKLHSLAFADDENLKQCMTDFDQVRWACLEHGAAKFHRALQNYQALFGRRVVICRAAQHAGKLVDLTFAFEQRPRRRKRVRISGCFLEHLASNRLRRLALACYLIPMSSCHSRSHC